MSQLNNFSDGEEKWDQLEQELESLSKGEDTEGSKGQGSSRADRCLHVPACP